MEQSLLKLGFAKDTDKIFTKKVHNIEIQVYLYANKINLFVFNNESIIFNRYVSEKECFARIDKYLNVANLAKKHDDFIKNNPDYCVTIN
jgi:hypothetical protein